MGEDRVALSREELHLVRQWFESAQDMNPAYLQPADYRLAVHIYQVLGWPVTQRVREGTET